METIQEAKDFLRNNWEKGCDCPTCGQFVKVYERKLNSAMSYVLILMSKEPTKDYFHVEDWLKKLDVPSSIRGDFSKLRYWGLIERKIGVRDDGSKRVGHYKITDQGRRFVEGRTKVQERVKLYNQKFYGFTGDLISIKQALGSKFSYDELMGN